MIKRIPLLLFLGLTWGQEYYTYNGIVPEDIKRENFLSCQINSQGLIFFGDRLAFVNNIAIIVGNRFKENDKLIISVEVDDKVEYGYYAAVIKQLEIADAKRIPDDVVPDRKFIPYDTMPKPLTPIIPKYPEVAQEAGIEGTVIVQVFVDYKGRVKETIILKGIPNTGFDDAAIAAIRETRFEPAKQRERPLGVWISIPVKFRLK